MAHIAIDARIINTSTGRYVERLVHHLEQIDTTNTYTILVPSKDLHFWKPTNPNFSVKAADFDNYSFAEQLGFNRYLCKLKPDLVHFCMPQQPILYKGNHVTTFHDLTLLQTYNSDKNWFVFHAKQLVGKYVFKRVAHTSSEIIVPTKFVGEGLAEFAGIDASKITVTYEAAEISEENTVVYKQPFKEFITYVGQQSDYKNIKRLGDAHQRLLNKYPDLGLILVGKKNASALANEAYFEKKHYKNILFTDFLKDEQLNWVFSHTKAYIFPSLMEGFGLPALEAMTHGAPVVSSNASCLPEVYGDAVHYFDPLNVTDIAKSIDEVLASESLRVELTKKGFKLIKKYSWKKMAEQTLGVYNKALKK